MDELTTDQSERDHKGCSDIQSIFESGENLLDSAEFNEFIAFLKVLQQTAVSLIEDIKAHVTQTKQCCSANVSSIKERRLELNDPVFDDTEKYFIEEAERLAKEETEHMGDLENVLRQISEQIESIRKEVDTLHSSGRVGELFIRMKDASSTVSVIYDRLVTTQKRMWTYTFIFGPIYGLFGLVDRRDAFGKISRVMNYIGRYMEDSDDDSEDGFDGGDFSLTTLFA